MTIASINWDVNPIFISPLGLDIAYYGLFWVAAFVLGGFIFNKVVRKEGLDPAITSSAFNYTIIATILGARIGHCLFYDPAHYLSNPIEILYFRDGGMASHGAAIGLLIGIWLFTRKWKVPYIWMLDRIGLVVTTGGALIRIGNLINSEVYGTQTSLPWGFIFPRAGETLPMHPTQIYEALAYLVLFAILAHLYWRTKTADRRGMLFGIFLIGLFGARIIIEFFKQPQMPFEQTMTLNMGQLLSIPFVLAGIAIVVMAASKPAKPYTNMPLPPKESRTEKRHKK